MNGLHWPLLLALATHQAYAVDALSAAGNADEVPSIEFLEYLAEFTRTEDGRLIDPLDADLQRQPTPAEDLDRQETQ